MGSVAFALAFPFRGLQRFRSGGGTHVGSVMWAQTLGALVDARSILAAHHLRSRSDLVTTPRVEIGTESDTIPVRGQSPAGVQVVLPEFLFGSRFFVPWDRFGRAGG